MICHVTCPSLGILERKSLLFVVVLIVIISGGSFASFLMTWYCQGLLVWLFSVTELSVTKLISLNLATTLRISDVLCKNIFVVYIVIGLWHHVTWWLEKYISKHSLVKRICHWRNKLMLLRSTPFCISRLVLPFDLHFFTRIFSNNTIILLICPLSVLVESCCLKYYIIVYKPVPLLLDHITFIPWIIQLFKDASYNLSHFALKVL